MYTTEPEDKKHSLREMTRNPFDNWAKLLLLEEGTPIKHLLIKMKTDKSSCFIILTDDIF